MSNIMDKTTAETVTGLSGVFATLATQHGDVAALFDRAKASDESFSELWPTIRMQLLSHEMAEVRVVYPVLRRRPELRGLCDHHDAEAYDLEMLIAKIQVLPTDSPMRRDAFVELIEAVRHHAKEEETEIFPRAQELIGVAEAERLEPGFLAMKQKIAAVV